MASFTMNARLAPKVTMSKLRISLWTLMKTLKCSDDTHNRSSIQVIRSSSRCWHPLRSRCCVSLFVLIAAVAVAVDIVIVP